MLQGLIVSCQARIDNPLHGPAFMSAMALSAVQGGAQAIRANGVEDIRAIKSQVKVPIIGINKIFLLNLKFILPLTRNQQWKLPMQEPQLLL